MDSIAIVLSVLFGTLGITILVTKLYSKTLVSEIKDILGECKKNIQELTSKINENTQIVKQYKYVDTVLEFFRLTKVEFLRHSPSGLETLITLKADAMLGFIHEITKEGFNTLSEQELRAKLQTHISLFKLNCSSVLLDSHICKSFILFYFDEYHQELTNKYLQDLLDLLSSKVNNVDQAFLSVSDIFFRNSLDNLCTSWNRFNKK